MTANGNVSESLRFGPFSTTLAVAGGSGAYTNLSGQRLPLAAVEVGFAQADAASLFAAPFMNPTRITARPDEDYHGFLCGVLEIRGSGDATYDYLISPASGALLAIKTRRNGDTELETFGDWRMAGGVRLPFHVHAQGDAGLGMLQDDITDIKVASASINKPADIALPPDRALPVFGAATSSGWIPFHLVDNLIFLPIQINGHKVAAILDSGAQLTVLDSHAAAGLGARPIGAFITFGQGGAAAISYAPGVSVTAGQLRLPDITAGAIDLGLPGTQMSPPLVAILGGEVFTQSIVDIDYPNHRLRFLVPGEFAAPSKAVTLPLTTILGSFVMPVAAEGGTSIPVLLDTGNDGTFQLFPAYWQHLNLLNHRPVSAARGGGVGGLITYKIASLAALGIGAVKLHDVPTSFEPSGIATVDQTVMLGNIGDAILDRFHLIIDFPHRRIIFIPTAATQAPLPHNVIGIETMPDHDALKIIFVMQNSPAAHAGLAVGDSISKVNGVCASTSNRQAAPAGKVLVITLSNGSEKTLTTARFY